MLWNAQSITNKATQKQLEHILDSQKIDILLLVETFLKPQHSFHLKNYTVYRNDRLSYAHGGVAIAIRNGIVHKVRAPFNTGTIENIAIETKINNQLTCIVVAYSPKYSIDFANDIDILSSTNMQYLIFGDFNAKHTSWNCSNNNKSGNILFGAQQVSHFMVYHPPNHTHYPHSGQTPSTIDLVLSNVNFAFNIFTHPNQISSDHTPVICCTLGEFEETHKEMFNYHEADWNKFRRFIDNNVTEIPVPVSIENIDNAIEDFTSMVLNARTNSIPLICHKQNHFPQHIKQMIQVKNALKRDWQRTHTSPEKRQIKSELNKMQKLIDKMVSHDINERWSKQLQNIPKGGKKVWNLAKKFRGKTDSTVNKIKINGSISSGDYERANCLAKIFEKSHSITAHFTHANDVTVRNTVTNFNVFSFLNYEVPLIDIVEVINIIKSMKPFKSPGPDTIPNVLLKNLPLSAVKWITDTFNNCIKFSYWPSSFKIAKVIPILKANKPPTDPHSYRPISLLNSVGKILEKIIYVRLINFIEEKELLPEHQFGFRRGHSTTHQAMRIKRFIQTNKQNKKSTGIVLLDIEKAFDSVWHNGLIYKLIKMQFPTFLIRMIKAFIQDRQFAVHVNNVTSNRINIPAGLAQGTCISPILYALYIADFPTINKIETALYADDTALYTAAKQSNTIIKRLNEALQSIQIYLQKWKIKINASKTQAILFTFDNKQRRKPTIQLRNDNHSIELENSVNYLGITFDKKLIFKEHITNTINKANKCFRALYPLLAPKSHLSSTNKLLIFTSVIRPIVAYGSPVWSSAAHTHTHKINILQNKIIKTIFKLPIRTPTIFIERVLKIPSFKKFIASINDNFINSCSLSDFNLIREIDSM